MRPSRSMPAGSEARRGTNYVYMSGRGCKWEGRCVEVKKRFVAEEGREVR